MPQLRATESGRANKDASFSPEISAGTYGGGLAHLQTRRQGTGGGRADARTHIHTHAHESPRLPESLTSQITDATIITSVSRRRTAPTAALDGTIVRGLQCPYKYASGGTAAGAGASFLL